MDVSPVKIAVFPVAGLGTRFLPATKDMPKEMLPLLDKPLIHHGVEEAVKSGCTDIVFVTGTGKEAIRKYFQHSLSLEKHLSEHGKTKLKEVVSAIPELAKFHFVLQEQPLGLGNAVLYAEKFCLKKYFALLLPDDVMIAVPTVVSQLDKIRRKYSASVIALEKVSDEDTSRYGIVDADEVEPGVYKIKRLVEKPKMGHAPSNLAIMGRYVLSPTIFRHLHALKPGAGGEYQLTDSIASLLTEEPVYGITYKGRRLDCGVKEGWIKATIVKALGVPHLREVVLQTLKEEKIL
jgi:UTP--glucose-1-phosphate uridylyltransferase